MRRIVLVDCEIAAKIRTIKHNLNEYFDKTNLIDYKILACILFEKNNVDYKTRTYNKNQDQKY